MFVPIIEPPTFLLAGLSGIGFWKLFTRIGVPAGLKQIAWRKWGGQITPYTKTETERRHVRVADRKPTDDSIEITLRNLSSNPADKLMLVMEIVDVDGQLEETDRYAPAKGKVKLKRTEDNRRDMVLGGTEASATYVAEPMARIEAENRSESPTYYPFTAISRSLTNVGVEQIRFAMWIEYTNQFGHPTRTRPLRMASHERRVPLEENMTLEQAWNSLPLA